MALAALCHGRLQELIDQRYTVTVYCHNPRCHHRAELDLIALRGALGPDHGMLYDDIKYKLRYGKCGGKEFGMTKQPPTMDKGPGWTQPWEH